MRIRLLIAALACTVNLLHAQKLVGKIPINGSGKINLRNMQGFALGDSIFLSYDVWKIDHEAAKKLYSEKMIVNPDSSLKKLVVPELDKKNIICLSADGDSLYFNFLEDKRDKIQLRAVAMNKRTGEHVLVKDMFDIEGGIVGSFLDNGFNLVTIDPNDSTLNFGRVFKTSLIKTARYKLPSTMFKKAKKRSIAFIREGDEILPKSAVADIKIYCSSGEIVVMENVPTFKEKEKGTIVTRTDRKTGNSESKFFKKPVTELCNSFFIGESLFWVYKKKGLHIIETNWNQSLSKEYTLNKKTPYIREELYAKHTVWDAISDEGNAFIVGYLNDDGSMYLKTGTHRIVKRGAGMPVASLLGPLAFGFALVNLITREMDEGWSLDYIFYLKKDSAILTLVKSPPLIEKISKESFITYEREAVKNIVKEIKYLSTGVLEYPYNNIRWYVKNSEPRKIEIARFDLRNK